MKDTEENSTLNISKRLTSVQTNEEEFKILRSVEVKLIAGKFIKTYCVFQNSYQIEVGW